MLGTENLFNRLSIEMNIIWKLLIMKESRVKNFTTSVQTWLSIYPENPEVTKYEEKHLQLSVLSKIFQQKLEKY